MIQFLKSEDEPTDPYAPRNRVTLDDLQGKANAEERAHQVSIHIKASTSSFSHQDGLSGQTAWSTVGGVRSLELLRYHGDSNPLKLFDHARSRPMPSLSREELDPILGPEPQRLAAHGDVELGGTAHVPGDHRRPAGARMALGENSTAYTMPPCSISLTWLTVVPVAAPRYRTLESRFSRRPPPLFLSRRAASLERNGSHNR